MAKPLVSDELWTVIEPLLPPERPKPKGDRPLIPHRAACGVSATPIATSAPPSVPDPTAEISRLRHENDRLRMERDISKKAVAIFSEAPR